MEHAARVVLRKEKMAHKKQAQRRNARALLLIILLFLSLFLMIAAIIAFVNVSIARIDEQFAITLAFTLGTLVPLSAYFGVLGVAYFGPAKLWPLFDAAIPRNRMDQAHLNISVPFLCISAIVVLWLAYAKTGGTTTFGTTAGEIDSGSSLYTFMASTISLILIIDSSFSFYRTHPIIIEYTETKGIPFKKNRYPGLKVKTDHGVSTLTAKRCGPECEPDPDGGIQ